MELTIDLGPHVGPERCITKGYCRWLRTRKPGSQWWCHLFEKRLDAEWRPYKPLMRLPECKEAER